jgi:hypothetical protein
MRLAATIALICSLIAPSSALAGKRTVPRGWLGVVVDGPMTQPGYANTG